MLERLTIIAGAIAICLVVLGWLYRVPPRRIEEPELAPGGDANSAIASLIGAIDNQHGSVVQPLDEGKAAFAARLMLIDNAEHSIDVQYYIWHKDLTGVLILERLRAAADRGVALRLLLDDNGAAGLDDILAELASHPNIEVRLYSPFGLRWPRIINYLFDFVRLNRRMHNKAITFDRLLSITGGRNIGDEYFDTGDEPAFVDLDMIVGGEAVEAISQDFARYWASQSAHPLNQVVSVDPARYGALEETLLAVRDCSEYRHYAEALESDSAIRRMSEGLLDLQPARARLISDAPDKTLGNALTSRLLIDDLAEILQPINESLDLVSPYFVPGKRGMAEFLRLAASGVRLRVLTNSLAANDVALVHAGYRKYRRQLLEGGVELYELKPHASSQSRRADAGALGTSGSSLHAKTFAADGSLVFVGSFNFDPRSVWLNTEMGLVIESEHIARSMSQRFEEGIARNAYRVTIESRGRIRWEDSAEGAVHYADPDSPLVQRFALWLVGKLPIEWLL